MRKMNYTYGITHPGKAHQDEFLAACVLLALGLTAVYRRPVAEEDMQNSHCLVFDQGEAYDPEEGKFDHHHDGNLPCALVLILQHFTGVPVMDMYEALPWLKGVSVMDCDGPVEFSKEKNAEMSVGRLLSLQISPIGLMLVDLFSEEERIDCASSLGITMKRLGSMILEELNSYGEIQERLSRDIRFDEVKGLPILQLPGCDDQKVINSINSWKDERYPDAAVSLTVNPRGGLSMYRFNDHPRVDFNRIRGEADVTFVHANGFLAVVGEGDDHQSQATWDRARELLDKAIE
jgi:hypothetical protein